MYLAGQGVMKRREERGYAMAALIIAMAVMAIVMTAAMPVWKHLAQREKEEELVFRGESIAHAIGMFQRRSANAYPPNIDVLVQQHFLRKKYKDPITGSDFVPIAQGQTQATPGGQAGRGGQETGRGAQVRTVAPGGGGPIGGIIGVTSKSTDESIRLYKGRSHYNEWAFIYTPPAAAPGAGAPGAGVPGGRGQRGQPGANQPQFPGAGLPGRGNPGRGNFPNPFGPNQGRGR
jgi:type II secretory pathway pseudopilin PulG